MSREYRPITPEVGSDQHFNGLYRYHQRFGWKNLVVNKASTLATSLFGGLFSMFLVSCVDWRSILSHEASSLSEALYNTCTPSSSFIRLSYIVLTCCFLLQIGYCVSLLSQANEIHALWTKTLLLPEDAKWIRWNEVTRAYANKDLTVGLWGEQVDDYVVGRIMRYDNYLIAMLNRDVFGFDASRIFTRFIDNALYVTFRLAFFSADNGLPREFLSEHNDHLYSWRLQIAMVVCGIITGLLAPFLFFAASVFFVYRHLSIYHKDPSKIGLFQFTPLAKWKLRDFNELPHVFNKRLETAHESVQAFLSEFADEGMTAPMRFLEFVTGSLLAVLVFLSLCDQTLLVSFVVFAGKPILFYMGILSAIFMWCQSAIKRDSPLSDPDKRFDEIVQILHYTPVSWHGTSTKSKYAEIKNLFRYRITVFLHEICSIWYIPLLFLFWLPKRAANIVIFLRENSVYIPGKGVVCVYSIVDGASDNTGDGIHDDYMYGSGSNHGAYDAHTQTQPIGGDSNVVKDLVNTRPITANIGMNGLAGITQNSGGYCTSPRLDGSDSDFSDDGSSSETVIRMTLSNNPINYLDESIDTYSQIIQKDDPFKKSMSLKYNHSCTNFHQTYYQ